jgi:hypothetical protein
LNAVRMVKRPSPGAPRREPAPETPALSRSGRKIADAIMASAKFQLTVDGKRMVRRYEVYGIVVTEWISAESFAGIGS